MRFDWKTFFRVGLGISAIFAVVDHYTGNTGGVKAQLILMLAYAMGLTYVSLNGKKDD